MHERIVTAVLAAARELAECIESREYPETAARACTFAYHEASSLIWVGCVSVEQFELLDRLDTAVKRARTVYLTDPDRGNCLLRGALKALAPLVKVAEAARAAEEAFACLKS